MTIRLSRPRLIEDEVLFNAAFLAAVSFFLSKGFLRETGGGMPLPLLFLGSTLGTWRQVRLNLPHKATSSMAAWLDEHPHFRLDLPDHATALVDAIRSGVLFGVKHGALALDASAGVRPGKLVRNSGQAVAAAGDEVKEIVDDADFIGRWLGNAGSTGTVMALWGIRP